LAKDVVRRILASHYRPKPDAGGPSWLTLIGHLKDSLWSLDLFRCESATLRTYWVLVVMDQYTRRIIGFGVHRGIVDGVALCWMFKRAIRGPILPKYLSSDHDPLFRFHQWQANLRILEVTEIKTVPYVPLSHPFVERLIGTLRREYLDRTLFYSGRPSISKTSCWSSGITSIMSAPIIHWKGEHLIRTGRDHDRSQISAPTDGNLTVEACIKHPSLPDSRNLLLPRYPGSIRQGYTSANCSPV